VSCLGHSNERVSQAIKDQVDQIAFAHTGFFTSEPAEALADLLIAHAPGDLDRVYFVSGGSEAVESAIKLARQYHVERGDPQRRHLIARRQSYHGNTLGALSAGGNAWRRQQFAPILVDMTHTQSVG
jgi:adenosylmethionine-8-amino-7-oxononanoate aminotransferase